MATASEYDGEVQMFVERRRELDPAHLRFLRWLAERGSLEHAPAGRSSGPYARADVGLIRPRPTDGAVPSEPPRFLKEPPL